MLGVLALQGSPPEPLWYRTVALALAGSRKLRLNTSRPSLVSAAICLPRNHMPHGRGCEPVVAFPHDPVPRCRLLLECPVAS